MSSGENALPIARIRISRIRFKSGGEIVPLVSRPDLQVQKIGRQFCDCASDARRQRADDIAGFVVIAWGRTGKISYGVATTGIPITPLMIPSFAKEVLSADVASWWAQQEIFGEDSPPEAS